MIETFVDPGLYHGGVYRASCWQQVGVTKGFRRITGGYSEQTESRKMVFVKPLHRRAPQVLYHILNHHFNLGEVTMNISRSHMRSLPEFFNDIDDPRRAQGRRHRLSTILGIAAGAVLCGMRSYESIAEWADSLSQKAREHFLPNDVFQLRKNQLFPLPAEALRDYFPAIEWSAFGLVPFKVASSNFYRIFRLT